MAEGAEAIGVRNKNNKRAIVAAHKHAYVQHRKKATMNANADFKAAVAELEAIQAKADEAEA